MVHGADRSRIHKLMKEARMFKSDYLIYCQLQYSVQMNRLRVQQSISDSLFYIPLIKDLLLCKYRKISTDAVKLHVAQIYAAVS